MTSVTLTHIPFADINKSDRTSWHYEVNEGKFLSVSPPQWVFPIAKFKYISVYQHTFTHASVPLSSCCIADGSDLAKSQAVRCALCSPPDMQLSNYRPGKTFTPSTAGPVSAKTKCSKWESPSVLFYSAPGNPLTHLVSLQCTAETGSRNLAWRNLLTSITMWREAWLVFDQINRQRTSQDQ